MTTFTSQPGSDVASAGQSFNLPPEIRLGLEFERRGITPPPAVGSLVSEFRRRGMIPTPDSQGVPDATQRDNLFRQRFQQIETTFTAPTDADRQAYIDQQSDAWLKGLEQATIASASYKRQNDTDLLGKFVIPDQLTYAQRMDLYHSISPETWQKQRDQFGKDFDSLHSPMASFIQQRQEAANEIATDYRESNPNASDQEVYHHVQGQLASLGYTPQFAGELPAAVDQPELIAKLDAARKANLPLVDRAPTVLQPVVAAGAGFVKSFQDSFASLVGTAGVGGLATGLEKLTGQDLGLRDVQHGIEQYWGKDVQERLLEGTSQQPGIKGTINRFTQTMGQVAGDLASTIVAAEVGAGGAKLAGLSARMTKLFAELSGMGFMGVKEGGGAYRSIYDSLIAKGYSAAEANKRALLSGISVGFVNALLEKMPLDTFVFANATTMNRLQAAARGFLVEGGQEAAQEFVQVLAEFEAGAGNGPVVSWANAQRLLQAGLAGGFVGGAMGVATGGHGTQADIQEQIDTSIAEAIRQQQARQQVRQGVQERPDAEGTPSGSSVEPPAKPAPAGTEGGPNPNTEGVTSNRNDPQIIATPRQMGAWYAKQFNDPANAATIETLVSSAGGGRYRLVEVPVDMVEPNLTGGPGETDAGKISAIGKLSDQEVADLPPGIFIPNPNAEASGKPLLVADGTHRLMGLTERGNATIMAYVPENIANQIRSGNVPRPAPGVSGATTEAGGQATAGPEAVGKSGEGEQAVGGSGAESGGTDVIDKTFTREEVANLRGQDQTGLERAIADHESAYRDLSSDEQAGPIGQRLHRRIEAIRRLYSDRYGTEAPGATNGQGESGSLEKTQGSQGEGQRSSRGEGGKEQRKQQQIDRLKARYAKEYTEARTDPLTGLGNRKLEQEQAERLMAQADKYKRPLSFIAWDLANFKHVNDTQGHAAGDAELKRFADAIRSNVRHASRGARPVDISGVITRGGGDEFLVMLPSTNSTGAKYLRDRIEKTFGRTDLGDNRSLFATGGIAEYYPGSGESLADVLARADEAIQPRKAEQKAQRGEPLTRSEVDNAQQEQQATQSDESGGGGGQQRGSAEGGERVPGGGQEEGQVPATAPAPIEFTKSKAGDVVGNDATGFYRILARRVPNKADAQALAAENGGEAILDLPRGKKQTWAVWRRMTAEEIANASAKPSTEQAGPPETGDTERGSRVPVGQQVPPAVRKAQLRGIEGTPQAARSNYGRTAIETRLIQHAADIPDIIDIVNSQKAETESTSEATFGVGNIVDQFRTPFSFAGPIPREILDHFEGRGQLLQLRKLVKANVQGADGMDFINALSERFGDGFEIYRQMIDTMLGGERVGRLNLALAHFRDDEAHPQAAFLVQLHDLSSEVERRPSQVVVDPRKLPDGATWNIFGTESRVGKDADGVRWLEVGDKRYPLDAIESAPFDVGSYSQGEKYLPGAGDDIPFSPRDGQTLGMPGKGEGREPLPSETPKGGKEASEPAGAGAYMSDLEPITAAEGKFRRNISDRPARLQASIAEARARRDAPNGLDNIYRIISDLARRFGLGQPGVGRSAALRDSANGFYRIAQGSIRLRRGSYVSTFVHELGHHLHLMLFKRGRKTRMGISALDFPPTWRAELQQLGKDLYGKRKPVAGYTAEGWAETVRYLLTNPKYLKKRAPTVYQGVVRELITNHPETWSALLDGRIRLLNARRLAEVDPVDQYVAHERNPSNFNFTNLWDDVRTRLFDRYQRLVTFKKDLGLENLPAHIDPHTMALRVNGHISGDIKLAMENGTFNPADPRKTATGPGLIEILEPIAKGDNLRLWQNYMVARRTIEKRGQGYDVLPQDPRFPEHTSNAKLQQFIVATEKLHPEFGDYFRARGHTETVTDPVTGETSEVPIEAPDTVAAKFRDFNQWLVGEYAVHHGLVSAEAAQLIMDKNLEYITFRQKKTEDALMSKHNIGGAKGGGAFTGQSSGIRRFRAGLGEQLFPPLESFMASMQGIMSRARLNQVAQNIVGFYDAGLPGTGRWIDKIDRPMESMKVKAEQLSQEIRDQLGLGIDKQGNLILPKYLEGLTDQQTNALVDSLIGLQGATFWKPGNRTDAQNREVTVLKRGKPEFYEIKDPRLYDTLEGLNNPYTANLFVKILSIPGRTLRAGATQYNPSFFIPNFMRDLNHALTVTDTDLSKLPQQARLRLVGMREAFLGGNYHDLFLASGADMAGIFGEYYDPRAARLDFDKMFAGDPKAMGLIKGQNTRQVVKDILHLGTIDRLNRSFELATRLGEFAVSYEQAKGRGVSEAQAIAEAGQAAADVTLDFQRGGTLSKQANEVIVFFNAAMLGADKLGRFIKQNPTKAMGRIFATIITPSILSMLLNIDNEDYWAKPKGMRDRYWYFPTGHDDQGGAMYLKIPKPYGLGAFSILAERSFAKLFGIDPETGKRGDQRAMEGLPQAIINEFRPTVNIAGLQPLWEVASGNQGYSFYRGSEIVSNADADLPFGEQGASRSSDLARILGEMMDYPPAKIDYLINGWFGGLGRDAVQVGIDPVIRAVDPNAKQAEPIRFDDWLVVRRFLAGQTRSGHEAVTRFFDDLDALRRVERGLKAREDDPKKYEQYSKDHAAELAIYPEYSRAQRRMSDLFKDLRVIYKQRGRPNAMDPDQMDAAINRIYSQIIETARETRMIRLRAERKD